LGCPKGARCPWLSWVASGYQTKWLVCEGKERDKDRQKGGKVLGWGITGAQRKRQRRRLDIGPGRDERYASVSKAGYVMNKGLAAKTCQS
jgi:hypothetical protein